MKKLTLAQLLIVVAIIACAGLALAGVIHPAVGALPLLAFGSTAIRCGFDEIKTIKYTHTGATTSGTCYLINGVVMHAINTVLANAENVFLTEGRIEYAKVSAQAWKGGDLLYFDKDNDRFTNVFADGLTLAGRAAEAAA